MLATTHSPIIIEQIANHVSASKVSSNMEIDALNESTVGIYEFKFDRDELATDVYSVPFTKNSGSYVIETFDEVFDSQLEEGSLIQRQKGADVNDPG